MESAFVFYIHRDLDGDRDKQWPPHKARQRNEIKGYVGSPDILKAQENQSFRYRWYFRIDDGFQITKNFCHFFQLKPVGSDNINNPLLTLSGVVDTDDFPLSVQFPFFIKKGFSGLIPAGTPIIQAIPFKRDNWKHTLKYERPTTRSKMNLFLHNMYKRAFHQKKSFGVTCGSEPESCI